MAERASRCVIFGAGDCAGITYRPQPGDYLIAADAGLTTVLRMGLSPDRIVGDFDSLGYVPKGDNVIVVPSEKDDSDMMLAIRLGLAQGCRTFDLYGATGSRFDHVVANIQALTFIRKQGASGRILAKDTEIRVIENETITFGANERGILSVFSLSDRSYGVTLRGLKYELNEAELTSSIALGLSNVFIGKPASVTVKDGMLLIVKIGETLAKE